MRWIHCPYGCFLFEDEVYGSVATLADCMVCVNADNKVLYVIRVAGTDKGFIQGPIRKS
jgi:hypothetical protein